MGRYIFTGYAQWHVAANGSVSVKRTCIQIRREANMFENLHWTIQAIPIVVVGGVLLTWLLGRHKEKKSSEHIFKI